MGAVRGIVIWAAIAIVAAVLSGLIAARKNRNASSWAAWGFIFPPTLLVLLFVSRNRGLPYRSQTLDEEDRKIEAS